MSPDPCRVLTAASDDADSDQRDKLFVILSLSSGGTRAAAFAINSFNDVVTHSLSA